MDAGARMLGIVPEEPSRQLSPSKDAILYPNSYQKGGNPVQRFGITPRRGGGKARSIPHHPRHATSSGRSEKPTAKRRPLRLAGHQPRAPPHGGKNKRLGKPRTPERRSGMPPAFLPRPPQCDLPAPSSLPMAPRRGSETLAIPRLPYRNCSPRHTVTLKEKRNGNGRAQVWFGGWHDGEAGVRR